MKTPTYYFTNFINSIIFLIFIVGQNPKTIELKDSFYNYIKNIKELLDKIEISKEDIKGKNILKILFS